MWTATKVVIGIMLLVAAYCAGYFTSTQGYKVVDSTGASVVNNGNAAAIVKEENARLGREVIGKDENAAKEFLEQNHRTMFIGVKDGQPQEYKGQKTFTNLTVEVRDNKVVKVLGWY
jgi:hypothetical protein